MILNNSINLFFKIIKAIVPIIYNSMIVQNNSDIKQKIYKKIIVINNL